jgi:hypothetical protein
MSESVDDQRKRYRREHALDCLGKVFLHTTSSW